MNCDQGELIGRTMTEMVGPDDPVRLIKPLMRLVNLEEFTKELKLIGGASYEARRLLVLWIFGLWDGERVSRKIEKRCKNDVRYIYLMDGLTPDHTTINRFRKALGKKRLKQLMTETIALGLAAGIVGLDIATLDGTKLPSAGSQWRKYLDEAEAANADLDEDEAQIAPVSEAETKTDAKKRAKSTPRKASSDPEARTQRLTQGGFAYGYNGQALVDSTSGMILTTHVTNCASDSGQLTVAMNECLEMYGELPGKIATDAGYDTPANAEAVAECGVEGWIPSKEKRSVFTPSEEGRPVCPAGIEASHPETFKKNGVQVIRLSVRACPGCALRESCNAKDSKTITFPAQVDISHQLRQRERAKSDEAKEMRGIRASTSELAFAHMKGKLGLRRLLLRGLDGAYTEFTMAALARNFMILARELGAEGIAKLIEQLQLRLFATLEHLLLAIIPKFLRTPIVLQLTA
jgi:transposase